MMKRIIAVSMIVLGVLAFAPSPALAEYYKSDREWVPTGNTGPEYDNNQGQLCQEIEVEEVEVVYLVHEDGSLEQVYERKTGSKSWFTQCRDKEQPVPEWWVQDVYEEGAWQYLGSSGYDGSCRCWDEYWQVWIGYAQDTYYGDQFQYRTVMGGWWEGRTFTYYD